MDALATGATWRWRGEALRLDARPGVLLLQGALGERESRRRAANAVRRLLGAAVEFQPLDLDAEDDDDRPEEPGFVVTDGRRSFAATIIEATASGARLIMFLGQVPPADTDLWVVRVTAGTRAYDGDDKRKAGIICFTPGTRIRTEDGDRLIEDLQPGDRIQTRDDGAQEVLWIGTRHLSGARLFAFPHLRPVRIRAGMLGSGQPDGDLLVSPQHRFLLRGAAVRDLFNEDEALVTAADLIDDRGVHVDHSQREVSYVHLLLERHQVIWANGMATESFHPGATSLDTVGAEDLSRLYDVCPELQGDPMAYGDFARRLLSVSEAAILRYEAEGGSAKRAHRH
ncbi:MAG: Hint domain-containing protein [Paracoccaceae bacterium]